MSAQRRNYLIDLAIVALIGVTLVVDLSGGFYSEPFGFRVSMRRSERPLFLALLLIAARWFWWRSDTFLRRPLSAYRAWFRVDADVPDAPGSRWHYAAAILGLLAVAALMLQEQIRRMTGVPDLGDPLFSIWRMGWVFHQLQGDPRALFDANIFFPTPLTLTLSDSMLLPSLFAAPLFAAGIHPLYAYHTALLASFPLTGFATYFLLKRLTGSGAAAFIGAVYYMCHPYRFEHYSHFELQMTMWMPLALAALVRFGETHRIVYALAVAVCAAAQLYSSMYYGVFFPFYLAAVTLGLGIAAGWKWPRLVWPGAIGAVVALALAIPLARPYLAAQQMKGDRDTFAVESYSADASDFLRPHPRLATHGGKWLGDGPPERSLFPGVTPLVLSGLALAPPVGPVRIAFTAGLGLAFDMTRGMKGHLYPFLYDWFSPIRGMRVPARFSIILGISLAVLAAFGTRRLLRRFRAGWGRRLAFVATLALVLVDLRPTLGLHDVWPDIPRIYGDVAGRPDVVLAEFPFEQHEEWVTSELPYMYFSLWHWREMVNGYSGFVPDDHKSLLELEKDFPDPASIAALRTRGVTHITVNCPFIGDECRTFMDRIDVRKEFKLIRVAHWRGRPTRLYEFVK